MNNAIHIYLDYVLCIIGNRYYANLIKGLLTKGKVEICIHAKKSHDQIFFFYLRNISVVTERACGYSKNKS